MIDWPLELSKLSKSMSNCQNYIDGSLFSNETRNLSHKKLDISFKILCNKNSATSNNYNINNESKFLTDTVAANAVSNNSHQLNILPKHSSMSLF